MARNSHLKYWGAQHRQTVSCAMRAALPTKGIHTIVFSWLRPLAVGWKKSFLLSRSAYLDLLEA